jgi:hypothetical protein
MHTLRPLHSPMESEAVFQQAVQVILMHTEIWDPLLEKKPKQNNTLLNSKVVCKLILGSTFWVGLRLAKCFLNFKIIILTA